MHRHEAIAESLLVVSTVVLLSVYPHHAVMGRRDPAPATAKGEAGKATVAAAATKETAVAAAASQAKTEAGAAKADASTRLIVVSLEDHRLALMVDGKVKAIYAVATGKASTPSPTGTFTIADRVANPTYYHDGRVIPPGPENPVGDRWMGLSRDGYGIHGTNEPRSIGKAASHGCIRMGRRDVEALFAQVRTGDTVEIVGERDAQTIALFGEPAAPGAAPAEVLRVKADPGRKAAPSATLIAQEGPGQGVPAARTSEGSNALAAALNPGPALDR